MYVVARGSRLSPDGWIQRGCWIIYPYVATRFSLIQMVHAISFDYISPHKLFSVIKPARMFVSQSLKAVHVEVYIIYFFNMLKALLQTQHMT